MSNPKACRDKYLKTLYELRRQGKLTQNDVVGIKSVLDAGMDVLFNENSKNQRCLEWINAVWDLSNKFGNNSFTHEMFGLMNTAYADVREMAIQQREEKLRRIRV